MRGVDPQHPRLADSAKQLADITFRAMGAFDIVAVKCKAEDLRAGVRSARDVLAEQGGLVVLGKDANALHARIKRGYST